MSPVGLGLDLLLVVLLVAALLFGLRLERRLRALRETQEGFAKAVQEFDSAAARAEAGLQALKQLTEESRQEITERLDEARGLIRRLQTAGEAAVEAKPAQAAPALRGRPGGAEPKGLASSPEPQPEPAPQPKPRDDLFDGDLAAALEALRRRTRKGDAA
jgi:Sec-independent protein translocase protein TatA